jgi:hypothetical protein
VVREAREELPDIARVCDARGVEFEVVGLDAPIDDAVYGNKIRGTAPKLGSCLFYQPLLVAGLELYPPAFVKKSGLRKIILCGDLHYLSQPRKAIPVEDTGTLYLDPDPEIIYYLQDVLHHEFFHIIDRAMFKHGLWSAPRRRGWDDQWCALNPWGFTYGDGGAYDREAGAFISGDGSVVAGFLNRYSTSAVEEDKAEIFAGLIRHPGALVEGQDAVLACKAKEMIRRLFMFCPDVDADFWHRVSVHVAFPGVKEATSGTWTMRRSPEGHTYWFNALSNQTTWMNPLLYEKRHFERPVPIPGSNNTNRRRKLSEEGLSPYRKTESSAEMQASMPNRVEPALVLKPVAERTKRRRRVAPGKDTVLVL